MFRSKQDGLGERGAGSLVFGVDRSCRLLTVELATYTRGWAARTYDYRAFRIGPGILGVRPGADGRRYDDRANGQSPFGSWSCCNLPFGSVRNSSGKKCLWKSVANAYVNCFN